MAVETLRRIPRPFSVCSMSATCLDAGCLGRGRGVLKFTRAIPTACVAGEPASTVNRAASGRVLPAVSVGSGKAADTVPGAAVPDDELEEDIVFEDA